MRFRIWDEILPLLHRCRSLRLGRVAALAFLNSSIGIHLPFLTAYSWWQPEHSMIGVISDSRISPRILLVVVSPQRQVRVMTLTFFGSTTILLMFFQVVDGLRAILCDFVYLCRL